MTGTPICVNVDLETWADDGEIVGDRSVRFGMTQDAHDLLKRVTDEARSGLAVEAICFLTWVPKDETTDCLIVVKWKDGHAPLKAQRDAFERHAKPCLNGPHRGLYRHVTVEHQTSYIYGAEA